MESNSNPENKNALTDFFGECIHSYTRADALNDGELVDISTTAREAGYRFPCAVTRALWNTIETIPSHTAWQDFQGRLWDCLMVAKMAIRKAPDGVSRVSFEVILSTEGSKRKYQTLCIDLGPDDQGAPVFTMGYSEDF